MKRKVVPNGLCDICKLQQEDIAHVMYHCSKLDSLWNSTPTWNHSTLKQSASFIDMLGFVFIEDINSELFISMIWTVWNRRKNLRLLKPVVPLNQLLQLAKERLQEHDSLSLYESTEKSPSTIPSNLDPSIDLMLQNKIRWCYV